MDENLPQPPQTPPMMEKPAEPQDVQGVDLPTSTPINFTNKNAAGVFRYIIAIIVGVAFLGSIFLVYIFFFKNTDHDTELDNTLSTADEITDIPTETDTGDEPKSELEEVVNEIKDQYDNDSTPPGMIITIPDDSQPEDSTPPETSAPETTKIPR